jgi:hypothetical protein
LYDPTTVSCSGIGVLGDRRICEQPASSGLVAGGGAGIGALCHIGSVSLVSAMTRRDEGM